MHSNNQTDLPTIHPYNPFKLKIKGASHISGAIFLTLWPVSNTHRIGVRLCMKRLGLRSWRL